MRISLFTKIFIAVLVLVVATDAILVGLILRGETERVHRRIVGNNGALARLAARNIETGFSTQEMPYEMLSDMLRSNDAQWWLFIRPDGTIYASSDTKEWGRPIQGAVPQLASAVDSGVHQVVSLPNDVDVVIEPMQIKEDGKPYIFCLAFSTREVTVVQQKIIRQGVMVAVAAVVLVGVVCFVYLRGVLTRPLRKMMRGTEAVAGGNWAHRVSLSGNDELAQLATSFNHMAEKIRERSLAADRAQEEIRKLNIGLEARVVERTAQLEAVHRELVALAHQAGMAEVATGVLHNVGNVLNSVNVSASLVSDRLRKSKVASLAKAAELIKANQDHLGEFITADERGKHLPAFLVGVAEHLAVEQSTVLTELTGLTESINHIKEIVSMQQTYAKVSGLIEQISLEALMEDAVRINLAGLGRHGITLERDYQSVPVVATDKHKVLQILVNLLSNAKYALDHCTENVRLIKLRIGVCPDKPGFVRVQVKDNGVGIAAQNLTLIFSHGFTTRKNGHGFGLHSGAVAAKELGGALIAASDGPGRGATFTLELPISHEATAPMTPAGSASPAAIATSAQGAVAV